MIGGSVEHDLALVVAWQSPQDSKSATRLHVQAYKHAKLSDSDFLCPEQ